MYQDAPRGCLGAETSCVVVVLIYLQSRPCITVWHIYIVFTKQNRQRRLIIIAEPEVPGDWDSIHHLSKIRRSQNGPPPAPAGGCVSLKPSDLKMEKKRKEDLLSSRSSCDHNAPVSFPFWPFLMWGVEKRLSGRPLQNTFFVFLTPKDGEYKQAPKINRFVL